MNNENEGVHLINRLGSRLVVIRNYSDLIAAVRILDPVRLFLQVWMDAGVMSAISVSNVTDDRIILVIGG